MTPSEKVKTVEFRMDPFTTGEVLLSQRQNDPFAIVRIIAGRVIDMTMEDILALTIPDYVLLCARYAQVVRPISELTALEIKTKTNDPAVIALADKILQDVHATPVIPNFMKRS